MKLAKIVGNVVASRKSAVLEGHRMLLFRPISPDGRPTGSAQIGLDMVQAAPGDRVLVIDEGNSARQILGDSQAPVRTVIVAVVDAVTREASG